MHSGARTAIMGSAFQASQARMKASVVWRMLVVSVPGIVVSFSLAGLGCVGLGWGCQGWLFSSRRENGGNDRAIGELKRIFSRSRQLGML
jgi:hypothetical protein